MINKQDFNISLKEKNAAHFSHGTLKVALRKCSKLFQFLAYMYLRGMQEAIVGWSSRARA
jgi:hypothetical protein